MAEKKPPRLTQKKIRELLQQAVPGARELKKELEKHFYRPAGINLILR